MAAWAVSDSMDRIALDSALLEVELLGPPKWRATGGRSEALSAQDAALIALLALEGPQGRDVLAGQIWPAATQIQAANNLRKHVSRLRRDTGHTVFDAGATLALKPSVQTDVIEVSELEAEQLLEGEFLAGFDYSENDFLHTWVSERRLSLRGLRADALAGHAEKLEKRDELAAAIRLAERVIDLAPLQEHAWRRLMRLHYLRGDHTAAIAAFERFERLLRDETGARPGPESLRLLNTIERGSQDSAPPIKVVPVSLVRPPQLVGRQTEWQAMQRAWSAQRAFLLLGEAGLGKSRLLGDFAHGRPGLVLERARAGDAQTPFEVLTRLLRAVLAVPLSCNAPVPAPTGSTRMELARLLPELGPAPQVPAPEGRLRQAAEALLVSAANHGLTVLMVDDLHFADMATLETLRWLSASPALSNLRFGFAARPLDEGPAASLLRNWLADSHRPERIGLSVLAANDIKALLECLDIASFTPPGLAERLHTHAGGHPLFTLETLKDAWLHRRDLMGDSLPAPQTVQTLIDGRLRELPSEAVDLVRVAAVAGVDFTAERAAALLGRSPIQLANAWSMLEKANVMAGLRFAHDLMQECALTLVPQPLRRALHALVAELLVGDATVPPGRVADHWQAAERWADAGTWWQRAGTAARLAGRLQEQQALLERAAACHRHAGNVTAEFEAVHSSFNSLMLRHGGAAVLAALPRLEALAESPKERLQCQLAQAEALLDQERSAEALDVIGEALLFAAHQPLLLADVLCLRGMALAQLGRADEAVQTGQHAADAAHAADQPAQEQRAVRSLAYVLYKLGRLRDALPVQQRALNLAQALGDETEAAAAGASVAGLHAAAGDVAASLEFARRAHAAYCDMGLSHNSTPGAVNLITLGRAAAFMGRFDEALRALRAAFQMAGDSTPVAAQAKARIALAGLYLTLGVSAEARSLAATLPSGTPPGMRMQAALVLARADQMDGGDGAEHLTRLGRLGAEHPDLPIMMSAWIEWSYQGDAATVVATLRRVRAEFEAVGRPGTARSLLLRETARLNELDEADAQATAASNAASLLTQVGVTTCASIYPPEAWLVLARTFRRSHQPELSLNCHLAARQWIELRALPHVPANLRDSFMHRNPSNRELFERTT
jgi:DNA-binding SARP family transcriptional activator